MKLYACRREAAPRDKSDGYRESTMRSKHENMSLGYKSVDEILVSLFSYTLMSSTFTQLQYCMFTMLNKVVLSYESVDAIQKCDHSNESCCPAFYCAVIYQAVQGGSKF